MTHGEDTRTILALNSGSSSLKFGLYRVGRHKTEILVSGEAEAIGTAGAKFRASHATGDDLLSETVSIASQEDAVSRIARFLADREVPALTAIGHRVVHGGPRLLRHCMIDDAVLAQLKEAIPFAPLHIPAALEVIEFARVHFPGIPHAACCDTRCHTDMPEVARTLPIPRRCDPKGSGDMAFTGFPASLSFTSWPANFPSA